MADVVVNSDTTNAKELLGQGIRAFVLQDYSSAVNALSKSIELLVAEHGDDLHDSLGDTYLYYGKALLGLSREDSEALGDAVRNKDVSDDEEDEGVESAEAEDGDEKEETAEAEAEGHTDSAEEEKTDDKNVAADEKAETNGTTKEDEPSSSVSADSTEDKCNNEEDPTDLQVAWEVLELAKKIYQKRGEEGKKHLAETLVILGEVSLESENFESAVNDIKEGLRMQSELFPEDSRTVAETFYKLGVAYSTNAQIDEAVDSFKNSLKYLQNRVAKLEKVEEKNEEVEEEISEIKGLIPDVEEKIEDMKTYKDETLKQIMSAMVAPKPANTSGASSSSSSADSKPAADISHLVKRKRKLDEILEESEIEVEASQSKKPPT